MLERILTIEIVRVTERAAVAAARLRGRGDEKAADQAAVDAMRRELNKLPIDGTVVIGEGERDEAPMLFIGEEVGNKHGPEGRHRGRSARRHHALRQEHAGRDRHASPWPTAARCSTRPTSTWRRSPSAPAIPRAWSTSTRRAEENIRNLAKAKGVKPAARSPRCMLDRPRHADLIAGVRKAGASVRLISDGDVAGVIHTADPDSTGIDIYLGIGGAPEGVLAAAALRCIGGQMQCRLVLDTDERRERAHKMGIKDLAQALRDRGHGAGRLPVRRDRRHRPAPCSRACASAGDLIETETVVMRSVTGTVRWIRAEHRAAREIPSGLRMFAVLGANSTRAKMMSSGRSGLLACEATSGGPDGFLT